MTGYYLLLAHLVGDYVLQSDWMAQRKTKSWDVANVHAFFYSLPFLALNFVGVTVSVRAWVVLMTTHALIDRYRLARYVVYAKEWLSPNGVRRLLDGPPVGEAPPPEEGGIIPPPFAECPTGYGPGVPPFLSTWLLILVDNSMHLAINAWSILNL